MPTSSQRHRRHRASAKTKDWQEMSALPARYQLSQTAASRSGSALMLQMELLGIHAMDVVQVWSRSAAAHENVTLGFKVSMFLNVAGGKHG